MSGTLGIVALLVACVGTLTSLLALVHGLVWLRERSSLSDGVHAVLNIFTLSVGVFVLSAAWMTLAEWTLRWWLR